MGNKPSVNQELNTEKTTIFQSQEGVVYRIPALFYHTEEKVFLAFAEKRRAKDDHTSEALAMKTGTVNNNQTTNELIVTVII